MTVQVVFVCTGNTCRSPMAAVLFEDYVRFEPALAGGKVTVQSAGLHASYGSPAAEGAQRAVQEKGLSLEDHRSQPFDNEMARADLILTMTEEHKSGLILNYPHAAGRVFTLNEYAGQTGSLSIMDPFGQSDRVYAETLKEIESAVRRVVHRLTQQQKES